MACRIKTLSVPISTVLASLFLVFYESGYVNFWLALDTLCVAVLITIGTNFINDGMDCFKGKDTARRLGFQRVSQSGLILPGDIYRAGLGVYMLALAISWPLYIQAGWPMLFIIFLCVWAGYSYTGGPYPLSYNGLGEIFVLVFYGWILAGGVFYSQTLSYTPAAFVLGTQMGLLSTSIIAINNFRDILEDSTTQKMTLSVRFGTHFARCEIAVCLLLPFILNLFWFWYYSAWNFVLPLLALPLAIYVVAKIWKNEPSVKFNQYFALAALLQMLFGVLLGCGFVL